MLDRRIGPVAEVGGMGLVHRGDIGRDGRTGTVAVVGGDPHPLRRLDQERGMADERQANLVLTQAAPRTERPGKRSTRDTSGSGRRHWQVRPRPTKAAIEQAT